MARHKLLAHACSHLLATVAPNMLIRSWCCKLSGAAPCLLRCPCWRPPRCRRLRCTLVSLPLACRRSAWLSCSLMSRCALARLQHTQQRPPVLPHHALVMRSGMMRQPVQALPPSASCLLCALHPGRLHARGQWLQGPAIRVRDGGRVVPVPHPMELQLPGHHVPTREHHCLRCGRRCGCAAALRLLCWGA